ncbi:BTAD domain-containing putative transcriptional regulator [Pseudonocardia yunnanensis]|uniref:BTAD domain-containing putative transcriptional regulator n=1 Tax=Pseudonocardia yunnanensis TaxID=58107 RepID=A0ABW4ERX7_9PSEU
MEFRILGPLEVAIDGAPVSIGGPKPRVLLAGLLLRPGAVVSTDRLVAAVWGDAPPNDPLGALRAYVSRLRAVLAPLQHGERLRYQAPGYVLAVADDELDATDFARLVTEARDRASVGAHGHAVELFDAALALWRGDPLAEFDCAQLNADITRLEDLRLDASEDRIEAMLQLGRGHEVVTELDALVRRFPERERLAAQLMRALYGSGRQAEALAVYRDLRRRLVDELGVEPSEAVRTVHRQLLEHDPTLVPAREPATNLPRPTTVFVGRDEEMRRISTLMRDARLVTLTGVGGVGKSRMALEVVAALDRSRFPDGVWLCEFDPLADGSPVSHVVATALRVRQRHGSTIEQSVIEYMRSRKLLLVLDNCEHVLDASARLAADVLAKCPGVVVLATSRELLGVHGEQVWRVPPLCVEDATTLFALRARTTQPDFPSDPETDGTVADICRRLDGLPLAIELAAARMRVMSAPELAQRLDDARLLTGRSRTVRPRHQSLVSAIDWSYRLLSEPEQQMFARQSVLPGGADLAAVHAVCAEPRASETETLDLLTALVDKSMVVATSSPGGTRYRVLETLRAYGRQRLPDSGPLARRHAEHFVDLAERAARGVQGPDERLWVERALPDVDNFRAAFEWALADRDIDLALRLVASLPEVLQVRIGYEAAAWAERALEVAPEDHPLFVAGVGAAARGAWFLGDFARARGLAARAGARVPAAGTARSGYPADVAADVALYEGDVDTALRYYESQVALARRDADPIRLSWTLYYVAICEAVRRTPERGLRAAGECLRVAEAIANPTATSMAHYALGLVLKKSDPRRALALFDEAASRASYVHNYWWQGVALMEAAATRAIHDDVAAAAGAFVDVLDHWDRTGDRTQQWLNLRYIIRLLVRLDAEQEALMLHHYLMAVGKVSPLRDHQAGGLLDGPDGPRSRAAAALGSAMPAVHAVRLARTRLSRAC